MFDYVLNKIFSIGIFKLALVIIVLLFLQNGFWYVPQVPIGIAQNLYVNPYPDVPDAHWVITSYFGPLFASFFNAQWSVATYLFFHLVLYLIFYFTLTYLVKHNMGEETARYFLILFFASSLPSVLQSWLGSPDIYTWFFAMLIIIYRKTRIIPSLTSFLLGINHFEQGMVILIGVIIYITLSKGYREAIPLYFAMVGLIAGRLCLAIYFDIYQFEIQSSRLSYLFVGDGLLRYPGSLLKNPFVLMFSLYNVGYIFLYWYFQIVKDKSLKLSFFAYNFLALIVVAITFDQTRVFSILISPLLLLLLEDLREHLPSKDTSFTTNQVFTFIFLLGILIPKIVVWNGNLFASTFGEWINYISG